MQSFAHLNTVNFYRWNIIDSDKRLRVNEVSIFIEHICFIDVYSIQITHKFLKLLELILVNEKCL